MNTVVDNELTIHGVFRYVATVRDVAQRAGVSTSTVSHVLNQTLCVSEAVRERVLAAMSELEYEPNAAARMLSRKRSDALGLVVSDIRNPFCLRRSRCRRCRTREWLYGRPVH
ncbi:MAG: hypothetical protein NVSMB2_07370 [Chloroflexota bacterium]